MYIPFIMVIISVVKDYVLVPSPYYRSFDTDFSDMAQAKMYAIDLTSKVFTSLLIHETAILKGNTNINFHLQYFFKLLSDQDTDEYCKMPFCLTVARLEQAYHNAVNEVHIT